MTQFKWIFRIVLFIVGFLFLHYFLPQRDIVKVVGTDVKRMDIGDKAWGWDKPDAGTQDNTTRDVRYIQTIRPNGKTIVYRNEDTGWGFPFYFKFDSSDVSAKASDLANRKDVQWVAVRHYGWRVKLFSIFPNATSMKEVRGPDALLIPWFNIVFIGLLLLLIWKARRFVFGLKRKHIDPVAEEIEDNLREIGDKLDTETAEARSGFSRFMKRWFGSGGT